MFNSFAASSFASGVKVSCQVFHGLVLKKKKGGWNSFIDLQIRKVAQLFG